MIRYLKRPEASEPWLLDPHETVVLQGAGTLVGPIYTDDGKLTLTTRRLLFLASASRWLPMWLGGVRKAGEIPLDVIASVSHSRGFVSRVYGYASMILHLKDGRTLKFRTQIAPASWRREIEARIRNDLPSNTV